MEKHRSWTMGNAKLIDHQTKLNNQILDLMEEKVKEQKRQQSIEMEDYRNTYQRSYQRRDFDLSDPLALKKDVPARISDNDPRIGISSLQRFEGEDLAVKKRDALQKEQMRIWTQEQLYEKSIAKKDSKDEQEYWILI
jgi:hypothetical protein